MSLQKQLGWMQMQRVAPEQLPSTPATHLRKMVSKGLLSRSGVVSPPPALCHQNFLLDAVGALQSAAKQDWIFDRHGPLVALYDIKSKRIEPVGLYLGSPARFEHYGVFPGQDGSLAVFRVNDLGPYCLIRPFHQNKA